MVSSGLWCTSSISTDRRINDNLYKALSLAIILYCLLISFPNN
uniref:Uncharacterized protein n=1 Tax=Arundo donax TaxID=35708 RepID=A0A0A9C617_ARUDO